MCGVIGLITKKPDYINKFHFLQVLEINEMRGQDSTGVFAANLNNSRTQHIRRVGPARKFTSRFGRSINKDMHVYIGHTRAATHGSIKNRNAHPFVDQNIAWAHNGVIHNYETLSKSLGMKEVPEVDSQILGPIIQGGFKDLSRVSGYCNFLAYDKKTKKFYVSKKDNPLWKYTNDELQTILFSSTQLKFDGGGWKESFVVDNTLTTINAATLEVEETKKVEYAIKSSIYSYSYKWDKDDDDDWYYRRGKYGSAKNNRSEYYDRALKGNGLRESRTFDDGGLAEDIKEHFPRCFRRTNDNIWRPILGGHGYLGTVKYIEGLGTQCHKCGRYFTEIASHIWKEHSMTAFAYRAEYGYPTDTSIHVTIDDLTSQKDQILTVANAIRSIAEKQKDRYLTARG